MVNYQNAKIYKLLCHITNECYIGATTQQLNYRLSTHNCRHNKCVSRHIVNRGNFNIYLIEDYPCNNKVELNARERYWIENTPNAINCKIPGRQYAEYSKQYYIKNKDKKKQYYIDNKDKIKLNYQNSKEQRKQYYINNKNKILNYSKNYYLKNKESLIEKVKKRREKKKEEKKKVNLDE